MIEISDFEIVASNRVISRPKWEIEDIQVQLPTGKIVKWMRRIRPDCYYGAPIANGIVYMTKEWRSGPEDVCTQFTSSDASLQDLAKELHEEIGVVGGDYNKVSEKEISCGIRTKGMISMFVITNFQVRDTDRDTMEFQEVVKLPLKGLYKELASNHIANAEILLMAKLIEEKYS